MYVGDVDLLRHPNGLSMLVSSLDGSIAWVEVSAHPGFVVLPAGS